MGKTFYLEITASDRQFYNGECEMMIFPAIDGEQGILPNHESMVTAVKAGELKFKVDGEWREAAVGDGFVEIMPEFVVLLADTVEWPDEIDIRRAREAKERAQERLRQKESQREYYHSKAALSRAMARLKVTGKHL